MAGQNVFGHLIPGSQNAAPQRREDPIVAPPDPYKQAGEARAQEDQDLQREANARAAEANTRAQQAEARAAAKDALTIQEKSRELEQGPGAKATESERKAAAFLIRALGSNEAYEDTGVGPRSYIGQKMHDNAPDVLNQLPAAIGNSSDRQVSDSAQDEFIAASLRQDSGAAIPPEELERQRRIYFPMPGDGEDAIEQKRQARLRAIEGLKQSAGRLEPSAQERYDKLFGLTGHVTDDRNYDGGVGGTKDETPPPAGPTPGPTALDMANNPRLYGDQAGLNGLATLGKQGISLGLSDEAAGVGGFIGALLTGDDPRAKYKSHRDAERIAIDRARESWPVMGTATELLGGGGSVRVAPGVISGMSAIRQGSGIGGIGGFGYGEGQNSVPNAMLGAAGGAAIAGGLSMAPRVVGALRGPKGKPDMEVITAGQRQNIPVRQPDARPELRNRMAQMETTETGGPIIRQARSGDVSAMESRVSEVGGSGGTSDPYALGSKVQEAGNRYIARTKAQASRLYKRASQEAAGKTVEAKDALTVIDQNIAELKAAGEKSNKGQIAYLEDLKSDFSKPLSIESVQNQRTNMRGQISERGLTNSDAERRVGQVIDAANRDLVRELPQSASQALRAADDFYRKRQEFVNGTLKQFLGSKGSPLNAETASQRLTSMVQGKGNFDRFSSMWKELEPAAQADVAATIADSLGRKANGEFSVATLVKSLDPVKGINPRTARLVFGDDGAKALADLRVLAKAKTDTQSAMNNSRTGVAVNQVAGGFKDLILASLGFGAGGPGGAVAGALSRRFYSGWSERRAAQALLNPDFTKWIRNAPNTTNPKVIDRYIGKLSGILAANDNQVFTQALVNAVKQSPGRVSAAGQDENN